MIIDGHSKEKEAMEAFKRGDNAEGVRLQDAFISEFREARKTQDHCPCREACKYHGKCVECVAIHRAHQDHLPYCFRTMVNEKIEALSALTEHTAMTPSQK